MITRRIARLALLPLALAAGCSDRSDTPMDPADDGVPTVTIANFAFGPATITIDRGTTVRWRNGTATFHTVTPDGHSVFAEWETNSQGQTFEVRFDQPGRYEYHCEPHRVLGMTGVIDVR